MECSDNFDTVEIDWEILKEAKDWKDSVRTLTAWKLGSSFGVFNIANAGKSVYKFKKM